MLICLKDIVSWKLCTVVVALIMAGIPETIYSACWMVREQSSFTDNSPIIITGKIVKVEITKANVTESQGRLYDIAYIKVAIIHKNVLTDYNLKKGDLLPARVNGKNSTERCSTDLSYQKGKNATWYVDLEEDKNFYICHHPQQCRPVKEKVKSRLIHKSRSDEPVMTIKRWIAQRQKIKKQRKLASEKRKARMAMLVKLHASLMVDGQFKQERMKDVFALESSLRREILDAGYGFKLMDAQSRTKMIITFLEKDPDESLRRLAALRLARTGPAKLVRQPLIDALSSKKPAIREIACYSLQVRKEQSAALGIRKLLYDQNNKVRHRAVCAIGLLGDQQDIPTLVKQYATEPQSSITDDYYCESLSQLGETKLSFKIAQKILQVKNSNHYQAINTLERIGTDKVIPIIVSQLHPELQHCLSFWKKSRGDDRQFLRLCHLLESQTKQNFGTDIIQWHQWCNKNCKNYSASSNMFNKPQATRLMKQYHQLKSLTKNSP